MTSSRRLQRLVQAMLSMTGRITQLGLSRWKVEEGSYRTIQRFFHTSIDWTAVQWRFFALFVHQQDVGVNDLRSDYRGLHYVGEILKIVPEKPDPITWVQLVEHICRVGCIHPTRNKHHDIDLAA